MTPPEFTDCWSRSKKPHATRMVPLGLVNYGYGHSAREGQWPSWVTVPMEKLVKQKGRGGEARGWGVVIGGRWSSPGRSW